MKATSGSRTVSGSRSSQTPASEVEILPNRNGRTCWIIADDSIAAISLCSPPADTVSWTTPFTNSPLMMRCSHMRRNSSAVRTFSPTGTVVMAHPHCCALVNCAGLQKGQRSLHEVVGFLDLRGVAAVGNHRYLGTGDGLLVQAGALHREPDCRSRPKRFAWAR